ncbi:potassium channel family protein [Pseudomonas sp. 35 E 8]|uniref:potassium channel family protein n=1 Tax=Pseudomonas sp. 35 E 8 TaxID=1844103 RepID=UPI0008120F0F|nr:potassium channel family protein [Pseudomonas sp. 35 E 8]CRM39169.1 Ion channel [Pseudomonas sp. 35 E 8]
MYPTKRQYIQLITKLAVCFFSVVLLFALFFLCLGFTESRVFKECSSVTFWDACYFSLVTITTLGYGDMQPLGFARLLAGIEAVTGLVFAGYAISQVVSLKQEKLIEHLVEERFTFKYNACLASLVEGKELIGDRRREGKALLVSVSKGVVQNSPGLSTRQFMFNQGNPFYPALRSMKGLNECAKYAHHHQQTTALLSTVEAAFHQIEELVSLVRKYLLTLNELKVSWNTPRTLSVLKDLLAEMELFVNRYLQYTTLNSRFYKNGSKSYLEIFTTRHIEVSSMASMVRPLGKR